jgi:hypothetical protein
LTTAIIVGLMAGLGVWHFFNLRGLTGLAVARAYLGQLASCCALMLAIFNLRFDVWAASWYGVSVAETHNLLPMWIVPLLSLTLVFWTALLVALTKPKRRR